MTKTSVRSFSLEDLDIHTISRYTENGYPWAEWDLLREQAPCYWYERDGIAPFWAITRHADVKAIGGDPKTFVNGGGRLRLKSLELDARYATAREKKLAIRNWDDGTPEDLIFLDAPEHTEMRCSPPATSPRLAVA